MFHVIIKFMQSKYSVRFGDAPWSKTPYRLFILGAGGIGSWLTLLLSRITSQITVADYDEISDSNIGGQLYKPSDIGLLKTDSIRRTVADFSATSVRNMTLTLSDTSSFYAGSFSGIFSCVDNMKTRKLLFEFWKKEYASRKVRDAGSNTEFFFMDGRMSAESFEVFFVRANAPETIEKYEKTLFDDNEIADEPCSFKATSHTGAMIASVMTALYTNHVANVLQDVDIRETPFHTEVNIPLMYFNTARL